MQQVIDIDLLKNNPQLFFSQLPEDAKDEVVEFIHFLIYKYELNIEVPEQKQAFNDTEDCEQKEMKKYKVSEIFPRQVNEFEPLNRDDIYAK